jgi:hypothetical protein
VPILQKDYALPRAAQSLRQRPFSDETMGANIKDAESLPVRKAPSQNSLMMPFYCKAEASLSGACEANRIIIEALVIRFME